MLFYECVEHRKEEICYHGGWDSIITLIFFLNNKEETTNEIIKFIKKIERMNDTSVTSLKPIMTPN